jgi:competence protein ComEA
MGWKNMLRNYFNLNKREKRGIGVVLIVFSLSLAWRWWDQSQPPAYPEVYGGNWPEADTENQDDRVEADERASKAQVEWEYFDPNTASVNELKALGLRADIAERIGRYREKGGSFQHPESLRKIYGIDSAWLAEAAPYMTFPQIEFQKEQNSLPVVQAVKPQKERLGLHSIDLNKADTSDLMRIPGIGSYYASQVIDLRLKLGGYYRFDQLLQIYKIRDETINALASYCFIDTLSVHKIPINSCEVKDLGMHPYVGWKLAKVIIAYRQQHGPYRRKKEIMQTKVISDSIYRNIAPYLTLK